MYTNLYWVQNSLRDFSQSAAQGLMYSSAWALNQKWSNIQNYLIITNERKDLHVAHATDALSIINRWILRAGIPASSASDIFKNIFLREASQPKVYTDIAKNFISLDCIIGGQENSSFFFFNNSYPSPSMQSYISRKGFKTAFLSMAPVATIDQSYNIITHAQVGSMLRLSCSSGLQHIIPARYPYFFRAENLPTQTNIAIRPFTVLTSGENILHRLQVNDFKCILFPLMQEFKDIRWMIVGVDKRQLDDLAVRHPEVNEELISYYRSKRVILIKRLENHFLDFVVNNIDVYYKGSHAGGGTTVAGCINSGIPVVDMQYADSRIYLPRHLAAKDLVHAHEIMQELISSQSLRRDFAIEQQNALCLHNSGAWSDELIVAMSEQKSGVYSFNKDYPREVRGNSAG